VHLSSLLGANRRFIEQHLPHIGTMIRRDLASVIAESDLLVIGNNDPETNGLLAKYVRDDQIVVDLVNLPGRGMVRGQHIGLCW
jgi:GDP-mannose 6-dehydrogenase